jgi:hypothetical protein
MRGRACGFTTSTRSSLEAALRGSDFRLVVVCDHDGDHDDDDDDNEDDY